MRFLLQFLGFLAIAVVVNGNLRKCCDKQELLDPSSGNCFKIVGDSKASEAKVSGKSFNFSEVSAKPSCNPETETLVRRKLESSEVHNYLLSSGAFLDFPLEEFNTSRVLLTSDKFCLDLEGQDQGQGQDLIVEACYPKCSDLTPCFRKCCGKDQLLDLHNFSCVPNKEGVAPFPRVTHLGEPGCEQGTYLVDFRNDSNFHFVEILGNGNLLMTYNSTREDDNDNSLKSVEIPWNEFCIELEESGNQQIALVCYPEEDFSGNQTFHDVLQEFREKLYPFLTGTSALFLLITSTVYVIIYKELKLPGWLQLCYALSLCVAFALLTAVQFWTPEIMEWSPLFCKVMGFTLHASFLSCFFWLTSMNVDLWLSFRHTPTLNSFGGRYRRGRKRFLGFALFSILIPVGVTLAAIFTDQKISESGSDSDLFTGIGETGCALNIANFKVHLLYFYGVVGLLLLVNLMFFCCTVLCLRERQRETKFARRQCSATESADLLRFRLFTRLFFVMGILWVFELLSWLVTFLQLGKWVQLAFVATDCCNALQGVAVFFLFTWKPQTLRQLKKKWGGLLLGVERSSTSGPHTAGNKTSVKSITTMKSNTSSSKG